MPNTKNQQQVAMLQDKVAKAQSLVVIDYSGTTANDQVKLRGEITAAGGEVVVAKNTLIDLAIGKGKLLDSLQGMSAVVFSYADPVTPIKSLFKFQKDADKITIKQGFMDDAVLSVAQVESLSKLPSKAELISSVLVGIQAPGRNLASVLHAGIRNLAYALRAVADKKEGASA